MRRHVSVAFLGLIAALGTGFCVYFSKGTVALDTFDFWVGTFLIYTLAMFQTIIYGWVLGIERGEEELQHGAQLRVPRFVQYVLKYVSPVYLLVIFVLFCWQALPSSIEPKLETNPAYAEDLRAGFIPAALASELRSNDLPLTISGSVREKRENEWTIYNETEVPVYVLKLASREGREFLQINAYKIGVIESILRDHVVLASILFIAAILAFLIVLVRIAGRRWEREGRLSIA